MNTRLLIVSCSAKKDPAEGLQPAILRYRPGAYYQMIYQKPQEHWPDIVILSARYGYLSPQTLLPNYNFKMDQPTADKLKTDPQSLATLKLLVQPWHTDIMIASGGLYRQVIEYHKQRGVFPENAIFRVVCGGIGKHRRQLKHWLNCQPA